MYRKILIPIDPERMSKPAFLHAFRIAEMFNSEVYIVNASPKLFSDEEEIMLRISLEKFHDEETREIQRVSGKVLELLNQEELRELAGRITYKIAVIPERHDRIKAVVQFGTKNGIDLIVMSMRGRSPALEILMGNLNKWVILFSKCPVLVVHDL